MKRAPLCTLVCLIGLFAAASVSADMRLADRIQSGERDTALRLIEQGADVNAAQPDGTTPLHWAVYRLDRALVRTLLSEGAAPDARNRFGATPLGEAVKVADLRMVELLLAAGADVEAANEDGQTALMLAARTGVVEVAERLLEHGAEVDAREAWRGQTALMWAVAAGHRDMARLLIRHGADVDARAADNDWARQITSEPRAQYRPTGGLTPLLYATRSGCSGCVIELVEAGADIDRPNPDGVTPLINALDNQHYDIARYLLEQGANPHVWDWWGRTALYTAVDMNSFGPRRERDGTSALDLVRMLLEAGVDPDPQLHMHRPGRGGNSGRFIDDLLQTGATPLLRAALSHDTQAVRALLEGGALVDLPNAMGVTPLMAAAGMGISPRDSRSPDLDDEGVQRDAIATLEILLAAGADINARAAARFNRTALIARTSSMSDREGQTALYGAINWAWLDVVDYLIASGARTQVEDAHGKTPLDAAHGEAGGRDAVVSEALIERLASVSPQASR